MDDRQEEPAGEAISQKAAFFDALSEGGFSGIVVYQGERVVFCNHKAREILDLPMDQIIGAPIWDIMGVGMRDSMLPNLTMRMSGVNPGVKQYISDSVTEGGVRRHVQFSVSSTTFRGKPAGMAVLIDVTEILRRRAEAERSEGLFHAIFDSSRDAMLIFDRSGEHLIDVNRQMRRYFQTEGMSLAEIDAFLHQGSEWERRKMEMEAASRGEPRTYQRWISFNEGGGFWAEVWIDRFFIGGEPHLLVIVRDIGDWKRAEETMRDENAFFSAVLDSASSMVVGADAAGRIVLFNRAAENMSGLARAQALSMDWMELLVKEDAREKARQDFSSASRLTDITLPMVTKKGIRSILWSVTPLDRQGAQVRIAIGVDITDREAQRLMNEELNRGLRLLNRILRHDITNDMMVAMGSLQLYERKKDDKLLVQCMGALEKSVDLINDMSDLEAMISSQELKEIDLGRLARKVSSKHEGENVAFHIHGECKVMADDTLSSVLDNLVRNALMHGKAKHIEVEITCDGTWIHLSVRDDGKGVPASIRANIFEEGFKYGETGNTGLGLYIVRKSMERYGGSVRIEDNHPKGACFILSFPAQPAAPGR